MESLIKLFDAMNTEAIAVSGVVLFTGLLVFDNIGLDR